MASASFGPCPHCRGALSYLQGVTGSSMSPKCPYCKTVVSVERATFLMEDHTYSATGTSAAPRLKKS